MSTGWETLYLVQPPPPSSLQQSPASPNEKSPSFYFNKSGIEKINFIIPLSHVFFEERSQNGCPKVLRIHLLGHEGCVVHFMKYAETVEALEFHGYHEDLESCFKICSVMKKLKDVRFYIGRPTVPSRSPKLSRTFNSSGCFSNTKVESLRISTDVKQYYKQSQDFRNIMNEFIDIIMVNSFKQFQSIYELRIELPDTDRFLSLSRDLMRLPKLPKNPRMEIMVDHRIYCKIEAPNPLALKHSLSIILPTSQSDTNKASPTCSKFQNKEDENELKPLQLDKDSKRDDANTYNPEATESTIKKPNNISYELSTMERLLRESADTADVDLPCKNVNNKRPGEPLIYSNDLKRYRQSDKDEEITKNRDVIQKQASLSDNQCIKNPKSSQDDVNKVITNDKEIQRNYNEQINHHTKEDHLEIEPGSSKSQSTSNKNAPDSFIQKDVLRYSDGLDQSSLNRRVDQNFFASFSRRADMNMRDDRGSEKQNVNRREREHRGVSNRYRGYHPRGNRGRGREARPYQDRSDRYRPNPNRNGRNRYTHLDKSDV